MSLTDITAQLAPYIDPQATRKAREQQATKLLTDRLGVNPNRLGGTLFNQALGNVAKNENLFARAAGLISPEERVNREMMAQQQADNLSPEQMLNRLPEILIQQNLPGRGALLQAGLTNRDAQLALINAQTQNQLGQAAHRGAQAHDLTLQRGMSLENRMFATQLVKNNPRFAEQYGDAIDSETGLLKIGDDQIEQIITAFGPTAGRDLVGAVVDGVVVAMQMDDQGQFYNNATGQRLAPEDVPERVLASALNASNLTSLGVSRDRMEEMADRYSAFNTFVDGAIMIKERLLANPGANTSMAGLAAALGNLSTEVQTFANVLTQAAGTENVNLEAIINNDNLFGDQIAELGADGRGLRSNLVGLAYMMARAGENGNSISNNDIVNALQQIGADQSNPRQILSSLEAALSFQAAGVRNMYAGNAPRGANNEPYVPAGFNWLERWEAADPLTQLKSQGVPKR